jgi:formylglycine-generating enzyme required for sulfatase activity
MVVIQGGPFLMGSRETEEVRCSDEFQYQVSVGDVWIDRNAVIFGEYHRFALATVQQLPRDLAWGVFDSRSSMSFGTMRSRMLNG